MRFKGVLFDLDGTLLDTLEDLASAVNAALAEDGLPVHPIDHYRYAVGEGAENLIRRSLPAGLPKVDEKVPELLARFKEIYADNLVVKTCLYPGIAELLDELVGRGIVLGILSNKPDTFTRVLVEGPLLDRWSFAFAMGQRPEWPRKPDPAPAREAARVMSLSPSEILYVGDTATDMKTAVAAGMYPLGVLWGFRGEEELRTSGAQSLIAHPSELLGLIDCLSHRR